MNLNYFNMVGILLLAFVIGYFGIQFSMDQSTGSISSESCCTVKELSTIRVVLRNAGCYGDCSSYDLELGPGGLYMVDGKANLGFKHMTGKLEVSGLEKVAGVIVDSDFFNMPESYKAGSKVCERFATDGGTVLWEISFNGRSKYLEYFKGCFNTPRNLVALESRMLRAMGLLGKIYKSP